MINEQPMGQKGASGEPRRWRQTAAPVHVDGDVLFVAGHALSNPFNQPGKQLPLALAPHVDALDIVGYVNFYGGAPNPPLKRLYRGVGNLLHDRVRIAQDGHTRTMIVRRLFMPQPLDTLLQTAWLFMLLKPHLKPHYRFAVLTDPGSLLLAYLLKQAAMVDYVLYYDVDYFPAYVPRLWSGVADWQEKHLVRLADGVASVSRPLAALREQQGAPRVILLPNGVEFARFQEAIATPAPRTVPTLFYAGTLDVRWGIDLMLEALPRIREAIPAVRFIVAGDGPDDRALKALASHLGLDRCVTFVGRIPYEALPALMSRATLGVATSRANAFRQYASPMKIVEYMAAGLPVIASGGGEAALMLDESGAGAHVDPDPDAIAAATLALLQSPEALAAAKRAGLDYAQGRSWRAIAARLTEFMHTVAADPVAVPAVSIS